jgi:hypothetical protein
MSDAIQDALQTIFEYVDPARENDLPFTLSRLTDDLVNGTFLGGGDIATLTPSGERGTITSSQGSSASILSAGEAQLRYLGSSVEGTFNMERDRSDRRKRGPRRRRIRLCCAHPAVRLATSVAALPGRCPAKADRRQQGARTRPALRRRPSSTIRSMASCSDN